MFEQTLIPVGRTRRPWAVVMAFLFQLVGIGVLLLIPMMFVESLPIQEFARILIAPSPPPPPPPPPLPAPKITKAPRVAPRQFDASVLFAPRAIPKEVAVIRDTELPPPSAAGVVGGVVGGVPGGALGGVIGGIVGAIPSSAPPPPPVEKAVPKKAEASQLVRVSGEIQAGLLVQQVQPAYPVVARQSRIEGTVVLQAIIGKDGTVQKLTLISGHPLLVQAAMDAVKRWVYKPTYLNGEAVDVITEVDVHFHMR